MANICKIHNASLSTKSGNGKSKIINIRPGDEIILSLDHGMHGLDILKLNSEGKVTKTKSFPIRNMDSQKIKVKSRGKYKIMDRLHNRSDTITVVAK